MVERDDLITFSETDKVIVLDVIEFEGKQYAFVNEVTPDEQDVTDVYHVMECNSDDNTMLKVANKEILDKILPLFSKRLENIINSIILNSNKQDQQ